MPRFTASPPPTHHVGSHLFPFPYPSLTITHDIPPPSCYPLSMPKEMERRLKAIARKKGLSKERTGAFVYGTMRKTGWKPDRERKASEHLDGMFNTHKKMHSSR